MFNKFLSLSTTIYQVIVRTTFTELVDRDGKLIVGGLKGRRADMFLDYVFRFGRKGVAINFVTNEDIKILRDLEQYYATQIDEMPVSTFLRIKSSLMMDFADGFYLYLLPRTTLPKRESLPPQFVMLNTDFTISYLRIN